MSYRVSVRSVRCLLAASLGAMICVSSAASAPPTALTVARELKAEGLPIGRIVVYTRTTDPNQLLGRPSFYTSKVLFYDTRIRASERRGGISVGGSVEVFGSKVDAVSRYGFLSANSGPLFAEYHYLEGLVLLRISSVLTPAQAASYDTALKHVAG
jgi:hypothetical protein